MPARRRVIHDHCNAVEPIPLVIPAVKVNERNPRCVCARDLIEGSSHENASVTWHFDPLNHSPFLFRSRERLLTVVENSPDRLCAGSLLSGSGKT
jgi:hypothetical protein